MYDLIFWGFVFVISLFVLVKGADYLVDNAEVIGLSYGLSPFIVGVIIVGIGTSLPELITSFIAVARGVTEIVTANAVGSNITNILLVLGLTALLTNRLIVKKNLIYLDMPLLITTTIIFVGVVLGREVLPSGESAFVINRPEAVFLIITYLIYLGYSLVFKDDYIEKIKSIINKPKAKLKNYAFLLAGFAGVAVGANYTIESVIKLSEMLNIGVAVISMAVIALGTSLPELFVSYNAAKKDKPELAIGNILGSSIFNILILVGLPGLFATLIVDEKTLYIGIPALLAATLIFVISGISNKVHLWDGTMYLMLYILFIAKLFGLF